MQQRDPILGRAFDRINSGKLVDKIAMSRSPTHCKRAIGGSADEDETVTCGDPSPLLEHAISKAARRALAS